MKAGVFSQKNIHAYFHTKQDGAGLQKSVSVPVSELHRHSRLMEDYGLLSRMKASFAQAVRIRSERAEVKWGNKGLLAWVAGGSLA